MSKIVKWEDLHAMDSMKDIRAEIEASGDKEMEKALDVSVAFKDLGEIYLVVYLTGLLNDKERLDTVLKPLKRPTQVAEYLYNALTAEQLEDLRDVLFKATLFKLLSDVVKDG